MSCRRHSRAGHALLGAALVVAVALPGCDDDATLEGGEAARHVQAHRERFGAWDRWARRTIAAEQVPRTRAAMEETLFAPVRGRREVVAAWLLRPGHEAIYLGVLDSPPQDASFRTVRDDRLGEVDVARAELPDRFGDRPDPIPCTIIRREDGGVTTAVAYRGGE